MATKKSNDSGRVAPKQERSKDTVETILKAATRILGKSGPEALNTNAIAEVAGVSVGSLYQYFRNKDSVIQELLHRVLDNGLENAMKVLDEEDTPRKVIERMVKVSLDALMKQGPATLYLLEASPRLLGTKRFQQVDAMLIPKFLERAKERGITYRVKDPEAALFLCIQCFRAAGWTLVRDKETRFKREVIERELTDLVCRYLLPDDEE